MGVYIYPIKSSAIKNRQVKDILVALRQEDFEFFNTLAEARFEALDIAPIKEAGTSSYTDKVIASVYGKDVPYEDKVIAYAYTRDDEDKWHEAEGLRLANGDFPHWADYPRWDDTGDVIEGHVLYILDPEQPDDRGESVQMAYSGYNRFRKFISKAIIGATPEEVWENPAKYENNALSLLVNGSDCEGIIVNSVVKKISGVLNDPESFKKVAAAAELLEDDYGIHTMFERYELFAKMFANAAQSGFDINFS